MSEQNHPNINAAGFVTDIIVAFKKYLRGKGTQDLPTALDVLNDAGLEMFVVLVSERLDQKFGGLWQSGSCRDDHSHILPDEFERIYMPGNDAAFVTGSNRQANARLIAAAPELLVCLEEALEDLTDVETTHVYDEGEHPVLEEDCRYCCTRKRIKAAIAKAQGRKS